MQMPYAIVYDMAKTRRLWPTKHRSPKDYSYVVLGMPRTGTTLACKIAEALGVEFIKQDFKSEEYTALTEQYMEMPSSHKFMGLVELWSQCSRKVAGMKWLLPLDYTTISFLINMPAKVIMCGRDYADQGRSTKDHFKGVRPYDPSILRMVYESERNKLEYLIPEEDLYFFDYNRALRHPITVVSEISSVYGFGLENIEKAASIIDPKKNSGVSVDSIVDDIINQL